MTMWRMRIAFCVVKATNARTIYVILISFPLQQWLHERASMIRYTYEYIFPVVLIAFTNKLRYTYIGSLVLVAFTNK
jgi:hypothetical protein